MPSPLQRRSRSPTPVLNLPPANDKVWNVVRNYDLYTSSTPTLPSKESHDKYLDQSKSEQKKVLCNTKTVGDIYTEQKLNILRSQTLTSDHRGQPPKPPGDHGNFAKPLPEIEKMRTGRHLKYIAQRSTRRANGMNGASGAMNGASNLPIHAGQQMDLNFIYTKVLELSDQLKANREQTQGLIAGAEELANRAATTGRAPEIHDANSQLSASRIADLTHKLSETESVNKVLLREQRENGKLIGEYEQALEKVVAMLRDFAHNKGSEKSNLAKQYLGTLQAERDEHLKTRLEKDTANSNILKLMAQMRHAHQLAVEECCPEIEVVSGLQNEVRSLRNALGLSKERFEDETGYTLLKNVRGGSGEEDD